MRPLRSLWAPTPIITLPRLAQAEAMLGVESRTLVFSNWFGCRFDYDLSRWCRSLPGKALVPLLVLPWALLRFDVFHFFADRGLLPPWRRHGFWGLELALLRLFRKTVFVYTYGGDVRTRERTQALGRFNCCLHCPAPGRLCICDDRRGQRNLALVRRYATALLSMGDMVEYAPASERDLYFWPVDTDAIPYVGASVRGAFVRIVHATNHRHFKGTEYLVAAVDRLQAEGLPVELDLVERVPNAEAMARYARADIVAEQFLIGFHGYTALEAMAHGKPVVSFVRHREYLLAPEECPIVSADPDSLLETLRDLVRDAPRRELLGQRGRAYVEKYYSLGAFAGRLRRLYSGHGIDLPPSPHVSEHSRAASEEHLKTGHFG